MVYKIIFIGLITTMLIIFPAIFGGNLISLLPIPLTDIGLFMQQAASWVSGFSQFGNIILIDGMALTLIRISFLITFIWINFKVFYALIRLLR